MAPKFLNLWGLKESNNNEAYDKGIISELTSNEAISEIIGSSDIGSDRVLVHSHLFPADESLFNLYTIPTMKNYLLHFFFLAFALLSLCGCDNLKYAELYEITDEFVEELHTDVESYGLLGGVDDTEYTDDGVFRVLPMGRLVNVKIEHEATDEEYEALRAALESHYADDERVTEVYRCRAGTIMIDCRH